MRRTKRRRRQRVVLRDRQRTQLTERWVQIGKLAGSLAVAGLILLIPLRQNSWARGFIARHTPEVQFIAPDALATLPLQSALPARRIVLWWPGMQHTLARRWQQSYPTVGGIRFESHLLDNRIVVHVASRIPLVRWQEQGIDQEGKVFPLSGDHWTTLPQVSFADAGSVPGIGRWLGSLTHVPGLWTNVVALSEDAHGNMMLDTQHGTHILWGPIDAPDAEKKARALAWVLEDAHSRLGGASLADARFFDEGRIVVKPKTTVHLGSEG